jgi:dienelactone hydrolase
VLYPPQQPLVHFEPRQPRQPLNLSNPYTYAIGAGAVMLLFLLFIAINNHLESQHAREAAIAAATPPRPRQSAADAESPQDHYAPSPDAPPAPPSADDFPPLGPAESPAPGITLYAPGRFPTGAPSAQSMNVLVLIPEKNPRSPLPCVFVGPAGTPLITGNTFSLSGDSPELYPYVRAGFAVCMYSLDGPKPDHPTNDQVFDAYDKFRTADAGLLNARRAMDFITARAPMIDANRFFVAGHSSAATLALLVAAHEPRVKACAAYCPILDITGQNPQAWPVMEHYRPGFMSFITDHSPITFAARLTSIPVLVFGSREDHVADTANFPGFINRINAAGGHGSIAIVATGDHYQAMIQQGIPRGIALFEQVLRSMGQSP